MTCYPVAGVRTTGITLGCDASGTERSDCTFDEVETFNYELSADDIAAEYAKQSAFGVDTDDDGLPDAWEIQKIRNPRQWTGRRSRSRRAQQSRGIQGQHKPRRNQQPNLDTRIEPAVHHRSRRRPGGGTTISWDGSGTGTGSVSISVSTDGGQTWTPCRHRHRLERDLHRAECRSQYAELLPRGRSRRMVTTGHERPRR